MVRKIDIVSYDKFNNCEKKDFHFRSKVFKLVEEH